MNRKQFFFTVAGAGLNGAAASSCEAADKLHKPQSETPLALTILPTALGVMPDGQANRAIKLLASHPHFSIAISNTSKKPIRLWDEDSSWGFHCLKLEITALQGSYIVPSLLVKRRNGMSWYSNSPEYTTLSPGDMIMREIALAVPQDALHNKGWTYEGFPFSELNKGGLNLQVRMRVLLEISPDDMTQRHDVWTGQAASPEYSYTINQKPSDNEL